MESMKFTRIWVNMFLVLTTTRAHDTHNEHLALSHNTHNENAAVSHGIHNTHNVMDHANITTDSWLLRCMGVAAIFGVVIVIVCFVYRGQPVHDDIDVQYREKLHTDPGKAVRFQNIDDEEKGIAPHKASLSITNFI
jgi:hypothetical protein